jgi:hypothetical protein
MKSVVVYAAILATILVAALAGCGGTRPRPYYSWCWETSGPRCLNRTGERVSRREWERQEEELERERNPNWQKPLGWP